MRVAGMRDGSQRRIEMAAGRTGVSSTKRRRMKPRYGAMPVPVATMMMSASGLDSGMSITLPVGPVSVTSCPGDASHR